MKLLKLGVLMLIGLLSICSSCYKRGVAAEYLLTDEMKGQNPFSGYEMLYFISDSGEQFILHGTGRKNQVHEVPVGQDINYYNLIEVDLLSFNSDISEDHYGFRMDMTGNRNPRKYRIDFTYAERGMTAFFDLPMTKENTQYVDSINIMEQWYYDVFINEVEKNDDRAYKLYYSTEYGVVKIDFSDDSYWELEKIEW